MTSQYEKILSRFDAARDRMRSQFLEILVAENEGAFSADMEGIRQYVHPAVPSVQYGLPAQYN